ncbi:MAG: hypothetical protein WD403_12540 [Pirellulales bacterium]
MTSPLRRKHPTTPPSTPRAAAIDRPGWPAGTAARFAGRWLMLGVAVCGLDALLAPAHAGQWKASASSSPARSASARSTARTAGALKESDGLKWRSAARGEPARLGDQSHSKPLAEKATPRQAIAARRLMHHSNGSPNTIILTKAASGENDPFSDPFEDSSPGQRPSQLKLFIGSQEPETPPRRLDSPPPPLVPPYDDEPEVLMDEFAQAPRLEEQDCPTPGDLKRIGEITNRITAQPGEFPRECPLGDEPFASRSWAMTTYTWKASGLCHKPLYFEQAGVERYAHSWGPVLQPVFSSAHFFATVPLLPYKMGVEPPWECVYPLGYYRPGSCAPYTIGPVPISLRGAALQAGAVTGAVSAFP